MPGLAIEHEVEQRRLEKLRAYDIIDTPRESAFDRLVFVAAQTFDMPIAIISFVEEHRQWLKASVGIRLTETPRAHSFCEYAVTTRLLLCVEDATIDERFRRNPLVLGDPHIRFYAGAPLITDDGYALGSLCVIDRRARLFSDWQRDLLEGLAVEVMDLLRARL